MASARIAAVLLGLGAITNASPMFTPASHIFRRQDDTEAPVCPNAQLNDPDYVAALWNDHGIGAALDEWLSANSEGDWVNKLASESFPGSGDPGSFGCNNRDQPCMTQMQDTELCASMAARDAFTEFWILNAVQKMQDTFERAHANLQDSVIDSSLTVSSIASDFKITFTSTDRILRYVAAAFGIAGGFVGYGSGAVVNAVKTSATMFGGAFAASGTTPPVTIDPSKAMDKTLKDIFKAQITMLDNLLKLAVGGEGDYSTLPDQAGDYQNSVAKFMADGRFLLQGDLVKSYFSKGYELLNKKLVDVALQEFGYRVLADMNFEDEASCQENYGAYWMDYDGGRCMRITYEDSWTGKWLPAGEDVVKKAESSYGMDIRGYFSNVCECHFNGNGEPDIEHIPTDGSFPTCFYSLACQDAEICLDEEGDHEWYICWPSDEFISNNTPPPPEPEEPKEPEEPEEPSPADILNEDTGCYGGGIAWANMHGKTTDKQEVINDINTRCQAVDGTTLGLNDFWWDCTEWTKDDGSVNYIWWEIQTRGRDADEHTLSYDDCNSAFNTEINGCSTGSQQVHRDFWFKMDPNEGECPFKKS